MPTLLTQREVKEKYKKKEVKQVKFDSNTDIRHKYYGMTAWRNLRASHIQSQPLCQLSLLEDIVAPAVDVHHILSPFQCAKNEQQLLLLLLDPDNLISLSKTMHSYVHNNVSQLTEKQKDFLFQMKEKVRLKYNFVF